MESNSYELLNVWWCNKVMMYCVELGLVRRNGELDVLYFIVSVSRCKCISIVFTANNIMILCLLSG